VVDDEPAVLMLVSEVMEDMGYTTIEATDGPSGLKILQSDARVLSVFAPICFVD
jgi:CheY-like chemotaxis protein